MDEQRVTVVFTGQSGLDKRSLLDTLAPFATSRGRRIGFFPIGEMMYRISEQPMGRILRLPLDRLELTRSRAFHEIYEYISQNPEDDVYVDTHATFRWRDALFAGFSVDEITSLQPDLCVNVIADVDQIKRGLAYSDFPLKLSLRDMMIWRQEEILVSELIAAIAKCRHFVVPRRVDVASLYRLIHKAGTKKLYLSYPISRAQPKAVAEQIREFRERFRSLTNVVVFDPLEFTEEPKLVVQLNKKLKEDHAAKTVEVETNGELIHLDVQELLDVKPYIGGQTRALDYRMIEQSDGIVAFVPEHQDEGYRAEGVFFEMAYAGHKGKEIYLVWPADDAPSPMVETETPPFDTIDAAVSHFEN